MQVDATTDSVQRLAPSLIQQCQGRTASHGHPKPTCAAALGKAAEQGRPVKPPRTTMPLLAPHVSSHRCRPKFQASVARYAV